MKPTLTLLTALLLAPLAGVHAAEVAPLQPEHEKLQTSASAASLPTPDPAFEGKSGFITQDTIPEWPKPVTAPQGAPNVVVILLDDVGFAVTAPFGGPVQTPELERLAAQGLRYNNFNTTGICSPTRAALLTGRNHHRVGFGVTTESATGYPGYNMIWKKSTASVAEILRQNGYSTAAFGKWHNTPYWEVSPVGPFERWPTGLGFEYYYGFMAGETSQWEPQLYRGTLAVHPAKTPKEGYHFTTDIVDDAIGWLHTHESLAPKKPYFLYFAPGATHEPHHVAAEWIEKYRGQFDQGWDTLREENFARQKKAGVIPANTTLTPRPKELPAWDSLPADTRKLLARQMEVFAGFMAHTDYEVGRLINAVQKGANGDNTLIFYITGDNGASADGGPDGREYFARKDGLAHAPSIQERLTRLDEMGGPAMNNHYSYAWGWANGTPFQGVKKVPAHFGGTRDPLVVAWPSQIKDHGGFRAQFTHVNDIAATIYEATGIQFPSMINGVKQQPLDGTSFAYSFAHPQEPSRHRVQYFEVQGNRAIYHDGWIAAARNWAPWDRTNIGKNNYAQDKWELYNVAEDFSQAHDVAGEHPEKLKALQQLFDVEARKNEVYPLGGGRAGGAPSLKAGRSEFTFYPDMEFISARTAPNFAQSHRIVAELMVPNDHAQGIIISYGSRLGGFALYLKDGRLVYDNNFAGLERQTITSSLPLRSGETTITYEFRQRSSQGTPVGKTNGNGGTGRLYFDGQLVGEAEFPNVDQLSYAFFGGMSIGRAYDSPVSHGYEIPFPFTGTIYKVEVELNP